MFQYATSFNSNISGWNVSGVTNMNYMLYGAAAFNQDISGWNISNVTSMDNILGQASSFSSTNLSLIYNTWSTLTLNNGLVFAAQPCYDTSAQAGRDILTGTYSWSVTDGGICPTPTPTGTPAQTPTHTPTPTGTPAQTPTPTPTPYTSLAGSLNFNELNNTYLTMTPGMTFGPDAFTVEFWIDVPTGISFNNQPIIGQEGSGTGAFSLFFTDDTTITTDKNGGGGTFNYTLPSAITNSYFFYIIYNRNSDGTTAVYLNGVRGTSTQSDTLDYDAASLSVGKYYGGNLTAYLTNLRVTIGNAVYDSTQLTQPTPRAPLTSLTNTKYLMLGADVTTDSSGTQTVVNVNNVVRSGIKPF
jgi:surface protein